MPGYEVKNCRGWGWGAGDLKGVQRARVCVNSPLRLASPADSPAIARAVEASGALDALLAGVDTLTIVVLPPGVLGEDSARDWMRPALATLESAADRRVAALARSLTATAASEPKAATSSTSSPETTLSSVLPALPVLPVNAWASVAGSAARLASSWTVGRVEGRAGLAGELQAAWVATNPLAPLRTLSVRVTHSLWDPPTPSDAVDGSAAASASAATGGHPIDGVVTAPSPQGAATESPSSEREVGAPAATASATWTLAVVDGGVDGAAAAFPSVLEELVAAHPLAYAAVLLPTAASSAPPSSTPAAPAAPATAASTPDSESSTAVALRSLPDADVWERGLSVSTVATLPWLHTPVLDACLPRHILARWVTLGTLAIGNEGEGGEGGDGTAGGEGVGSGSGSGTGGGERGRKGGGRGGATQSRVSLGPPPPTAPTGAETVITAVALERPPSASVAVPLSSLETGADDPGLEDEQRVRYENISSLGSLHSPELSDHPQGRDHPGAQVRPHPRRSRTPRRRGEDASRPEERSRSRSRSSSPRSRRSSFSFDRRSSGADDDQEARDAETGAMIEGARRRLRQLRRKVERLRAERDSLQEALATARATVRDATELAETERARATEADAMRAQVLSALEAAQAQLRGWREASAAGAGVGGLGLVAGSGVVLPGSGSTTPLGSAAPTSVSPAVVMDEIARLQLELVDALQARQDDVRSHDGWAPAQPPPPPNARFFQNLRPTAPPSTPPTMLVHLCAGGGGEGGTRGSTRGGRGAHERRARGGFPARVTGRATAGAA